MTLGGTDKGKKKPPRWGSAKGEWVGTQSRIDEGQKRDIIGRALGNAWRKIKK